MEEKWISVDSEGWAFWSAKPRPNNRGDFSARNGDQSEEVKLVNEFQPEQIDCVICHGETAKVCLESPITIDACGRFVVPVVAATVEGP